jgi:hypothetical protein
MSVVVCSLKGEAANSVAQKITYDNDGYTDVKTPQAPARGCGSDGRTPGTPQPPTDTSNRPRLASARASGVRTGRGTTIPQAVQTGPEDGS